MKIMISIISWRSLLFNNIGKTLEDSVSSPSPTLVDQAGFWSSVQWWSLSSPSWPEGPKPFAGQWPSCHSYWVPTSCTCAFPRSDLTDNRGSSEPFLLPDRLSAGRLFFTFWLLVRLVHLQSGQQTDKPFKWPLVPVDPDEVNLRGPKQIRSTSNTFCYATTWWVTPLWRFLTLRNFMLLSLMFSYQE